VIVLAGLLTDAYFWHRSAGAHNVAVSPVATAESAAPLPSATPLPSPSPIPVPTMSLVADVTSPTIDVYGTPAVGKVLAQFPGVNPMGQTEALLVVDASVPGWYEVELPVKPNGSEGWISAAGISIRQDQDYIRVYQSQFRLEWYVGGQLVKAFRVAVGAPSTPTPYGRFFVWASEPFGPPYTPGIFALSGFSPVLDNWPGGGRVGIHGWTDTSIIGTRASHGCVRMAPTDFAQLLHTVPLGTPVDILT
jgi:lipoprotein-anchoring transpeptidase ErfK/SrfK